MLTNVLMSGPIRPNESAVLEVIQAIRSQIPQSRIFLSTWTDSPGIRAAVDVYQVIREPSDFEIATHVTGRTVQQRQLNLPDNTPGCKFSTYRMFYGVGCVCGLARPYLTDSDRVLRIRTDAILRFDPDYLQSLLTAPSSTYIAKAGDGFDWFALTAFGTLLNTWSFSNMQEYNAWIEQCWNPEEAVRRRVPVPIQYIDNEKVDAYILRENGRKHYYP